ncbi:MAG: hypothetical protein NTW52_13690 [Planctomycetota bacterium]|nr:hypothetical protein [Planctomycetota bacterium]
MRLVLDTENAEDTEKTFETPCVGSVCAPKRSQEEVTRTCMGTGHKDMHKQGHKDMHCFGQQGHKDMHCFGRRLLQRHQYCNMDENAKELTLLGVADAMSG